VGCMYLRYLCIRRVCRRDRSDAHGHARSRLVCIRVYAQRQQETCPKSNWRCSCILQRCVASSPHCSTSRGCQTSCCLPCGYHVPPHLSDEACSILTFRSALNIERPLVRPHFADATLAPTSSLCTSRVCLVHDAHRVSWFGITAPPPRLSADSASRAAHRPSSPHRQRGALRLQN